ncbi:MAG: gluconokinase [Dictyoglomaceae bacterium]
MEELILAIDIGTTNIKAGIIDEYGNLLKVKSKELPIEKDNSGKAEHNPEEIFNIFVLLVREIVTGYEDRISLLILSSYMFGLLPLDKNLKPLTGIITLLDLRSRETFEELYKLVDFEELYRRTGCPPLFIYPFSRIYWLKRKKGEIFEKARYYIGSKDYFLLRLLGDLYTEPSQSISTQLMNVHTLTWDPYPLEFLGIKEENLPIIVPPEKILGKLPLESSKLLGLKREVYVLTGVYDGGAVGLGIGAMGDSVGVINIGTTGMLRVAYPKPVIDKDKTMRFQAYFLCSNKWYIGGAINNAGIILKWFRDNIFNLSYEELTFEAQKDDSKNLFFLPFITGERYPEIGNIASGVFFGLKSFHNKNHMIRAGLEGVAFTLKMAFDALRENNIEIKELRAGGGGTRSSLWMNIFASVFNMPIKVTESEEAGLLGSAILGYTALKKFKSLEEATEKLVRIKNVYYPSEDLVEDYKNKFEFFRFLVKNLKEAFERHNNL